MSVRTGTFEISVVQEVRQSCKSCRIISLSIACKRLADAVYTRLKQQTAERIKGDYPKKVRSGGTIYIIYTLEQIFEKHWEYNSVTHARFIDFKSAYN